MPVTAPTDLPWHDPAWQGRARAWVEESLAAAGRRVTGPLEHRHVRAWSAVWFVPTDAGGVWFKANGGASTYEAGLLAVLADRAPDRVLRPLAVDAAEGWSLLPDGGATLRALPVREHLAHWERVLPAYADLQVRLAARVPELLAAGVPDHRPAAMPALLDRLLADERWLLVGEPDGLDVATLDRLRAVRPEFAGWCDRLAAGLPATVQHDDLHDGNVFAGPAGYRFFDWGDSSVGHPFGTLLVTLRAVGHRLELAPGDAALLRLRDAYLEPWTAGRDRRELLDQVGLATRVATVGRAASWRRALSGVRPDQRGEHAGAVPGWLAELVDGS
jgi:hypothetical protein